MTRYLLLFTLGPVQGFIAQARKTQDFYAGSYILSHLSRISLLRAEELGAKIIFPDPQLQGLPNRFLLEICVDEEAKVKTIGQELEKTLRKEFEQFARTTVEKMGLALSPEFNEQIRNTLEVYWVSLPIGERGYAKTYRHLCLQMAGIKNLREFKQLKQIPSRRCLLAGEHNVLFIRPREKSRSIFAPGAQRVGVEIPLKYLAEGEGLGAVAFVKRCADKYFGADFEGEFDSTPKIALYDALNRLEKADPSYGPLLNSDFDPLLIFDLQNQNRQVLYSKETEIPLRIYEGLKEYEIPISPYYGLLVFDGDDIGKLYSEPALHPDRTLREFHGEFSRVLAEFGQRVQNQILCPPIGRTVYAGGEDFVGFLNLKYLFSAAQQLRDEFGQIDLGAFIASQLTFSAGIVVAHYKTPLAKVFNWARKMEAGAKEIDEKKDAFGLAILKGSGEIHEAVLKWKYGEGWTTETLRLLVLALKEGEYSPTFIRSFNQQFSKLANLGYAGEIPSLDSMVKTELKRLIERAKMEDTGSLAGSGGSHNDKEQSWANKLYTLYLDSGSLVNFIKTLEIAAFLAKN